MKEMKFLEIINNTLTKTKFLGEDCAYLPDLNIFVTQDTLCEGVHFEKRFTTPYNLAKKCVAVNLSDLAANLANPKYISVSLSLHSEFKETCFEKFYKGIEDCCNKYGITVSGGDLTGSKNKMCVSMCAIGTPIKGNKSTVSRSYAKEGQIVCITKEYGSSAYALYCLMNNIECSEEILNTHNCPEPDLDISQELADLNYEQIAIMDSSDGLVDALYKIAKASDKSIEIDIERVPYNKEIENHKGYKDLILWGGEDYGLVFCIDEKDLFKLKNPRIKPIGKVINLQKDFAVKINDTKINDEVFLKRSYNHFLKEE